MLSPQRRQALVEEMARLQSAVEYLDRKQEFYDEVLAGRMPYVSNLLPQK